MRKDMSVITLFKSPFPYIFSVCTYVSLSFLRKEQGHRHKHFTSATVLESHLGQERTSLKTTFTLSVTTFFEKGRGQPNNTIS